jgi:putative transcriptional regulator
MNERLFHDFVCSMEEAVAIERGEARPAHETRFPVPDTRAVRRRLGVTQFEFSQLIGVSLATLHNWEQGRRQSHGPARVLLLVAERHPEAVWQVVCGYRDRRELDAP